ncbi:hypothetical protein V8C34DRAFT_325171 [Trichoderma compactum]
MSDHRFALRMALNIYEQQRYSRMSLQQLCLAGQNQTRCDIIKDNPLGSGLDILRIPSAPTPESLDCLSHNGTMASSLNITLVPLSTLQNIPGARILPARTGRGTLRNDLLRLELSLSSDDLSPDELKLDRFKPLSTAALSEIPNDVLIWDQQTPWLHNTSSFVNSSEYRQDVDRVLKMELGPLYIVIPGFHEAFFGCVPDLQTASEAVFKKCLDGNQPLFQEGWVGWPRDANQDEVLTWFTDISEKLAEFAGGTPEKNSRHHWLQILIPGELKSNPSADTVSKAPLDLGRYAREVLAAQDARRFALGFTLCGSLMRIWEFDRLGGIASEQLNINENGLRFLGFDPTIITANGQRFIEIERNGVTERLIIDEMMNRANCIAGRATTCWKAHREGETQMPLVIKDSWQYTERDEEGELLHEATASGVVKVARYYHHETVLIDNEIDDILLNVRRNSDITRAQNHRPERAAPPRRSTAGVKRSSSQTGALLPPSKRRCSESPTKPASNTLPNRVHRRVVVRDYGQPIYKASSRSALLSALEGCIQGHESLRHNAKLLHRDISINNLMVNEDGNNPSWSSFLIDLDLAIKEQRDGASGAKRKTGTRALMAIGALLGEQHSFMHDLESFFWVLFWICIHYNGPDKSMVELAVLKRGVIGDEGDFIDIVKEYFTLYYQPLVPWVNRLRKELFPNGERWKKPKPQLYSSITRVLGDARKDPKILGDEEPCVNGPYKSSRY